MENQLFFLGFFSWLWISIIAVAVSLIWFFVLNIRLAGGYWGELIIAWLGAWLGTPIAGNWDFLTFNHVSLIPAIIGSVAAVMAAKSGFQWVRVIGGKEPE
ncbi:MAG: hypothetical protein ACE5QV_08455 [Fidelibacterota bacterium]